MRTSEESFRATHACANERCAGAVVPFRVTPPDRSGVPVDVAA
jgi:hypothetical protein